MRWSHFCAVTFFFLVFASTSYSNAQTVGAPTRKDSSAIRVQPKKASPRSVMLRSLLVPGWGQYYNRQYLKAAIAFGAEVGLVTTAIYWNSKAKGASDRETKLFYQNNRNTANWFLLGTVLFSMLDAYVDASLADFDESPDLSLTPPAVRSTGVKLTVKIGL
ncbi:MAG: hypothetical protein ALAOOOJD_02514 [bacterium]|nr:hypothetical protein [bacterium]